MPTQEATLRLHNTTGQWKTGLFMAVTASVLWGVLPIALAIVMQNMDAYTVTWYRFAAAGLVLGTILGATGGLPPITPFRFRTWLLVGVAVAGLSGNYVLYLMGLARTSPTIAQIISQIGPMFLLLGGFIIFKEHFSGSQWAGLAILLVGLVLFFNDRIQELMHPTQGMGLGVAILIVATLAWSLYGLAQKSLLHWLRPQQILLLVYAGAVILLAPQISLQSIRSLNALQFWMLGFCCLNTLLAYGAFAEGLKHWEISRVGAVLATSPLFTVVSMWAVEVWAPNLVSPERLNTTSLIGMVLVVGGSILCALAARGRRR